MSLSCHEMNPTASSEVWQKIEADYHELNMNVLKLECRDEDKTSEVYPMTDISDPVSGAIRTVD
jgi:hypothetical protein